MSNDNLTVQAEKARSDEQADNTIEVYETRYNAPPQAFVLGYQKVSTFAPVADVINKPPQTTASEDQRVIDEMNLYDLNYLSRNSLMVEIYGAQLEEEAAKHRVIERQGFIANGDAAAAQLSHSVSQRLTQTLAQAQKEKKRTVAEQEINSKKEEADLAAKFYSGLAEEADEMAKSLDIPNPSWKDLFKILTKARANCELARNFEDVLSPPSDVSVLIRECKIMDYADTIDDCFDYPFAGFSSRRAPEYVKYGDSVNALSEKFEALVNEKMKAGATTKQALRNIFDRMVNDADDPKRIAEFIDEAGIVGYFSDPNAPRYFNFNMALPFKKLARLRQNLRQKPAPLDVIDTAQKKIANEVAAVKKDYKEQPDIQKHLLAYFYDLQSCAHSLIVDSKVWRNDDLAAKLIADYENTIAQNDRPCCETYHLPGETAKAQAAAIQRKLLVQDQDNMSVVVPEAYIKFRAESGDPLSPTAENRLMAKAAFAEAQSASKKVALEADSFEFSDPKYMQKVKAYGEYVLDHLDQIESFKVQKKAIEKVIDGEETKASALTEKGLQDSETHQKQLFDLYDEKNKAEARGVLFVKKLAMSAREQVGDSYDEDDSTPHSSAITLTREVKNGGVITVHAHYELPNIDSPRQLRDVEVTVTPDQKIVKKYFENGRAVKPPEGTDKVEIFE